MNGFFILDLAKNHNIKYVFASSSSVYQKLIICLLLKKNYLQTSSFYGETKLFNENLAKYITIFIYKFYRTIFLQYMAS